MNSNVIMIPAKKADASEQKLRTAAYCRVSSDSEDQLNSYMAQVRYYEKFLSESDTAILVNVYADEGITGTRMDKRDEFLRMLRDCRKGKIDRIITKSVSRFARNTKECLSVIRELKELDITIMFEKESIDTANISDEMMITIMGGLAQEESSSISNNLRWSIKKKMQSGTYTIPKAPYGYRLINKKLVIDKCEAEVVKYIFDSYLKGKGISIIAAELNKNQYSKINKNKWTYGTVRFIILNEKYTGNSLLQKNCTTKTFPFRVVKNNGYQDKYFIKNSHPQIISEDIFEKAQAIIKSRSFEYNERQYPLSKKIICSECGSKFRIKRVRDKTYWECYNHNDSADNCSIKQIPELVFYESFMAMYNKLKRQYSNILTPLLSQLQELKNKKHIGNQQYMDIQKETAKLKEQLHVLARLKTKGFIDNEKYLSQTAELNSKIEKLTQELRKISASDYEDEVIDQISELAAIIENGTEFITEFDEVMFESLIEKIIVMDQNTLEFHLYGGLRFTEKIK